MIRKNTQNPVGLVKAMKEYNKMRRRDVTDRVMLAVGIFMVIALSMVALVLLYN